MKKHKSYITCLLIITSLFLFYLLQNFIELNPQLIDRKLPKKLTEEVLKNPYQFNEQINLPNKDTTKSKIIFENYSDHLTSLISQKKSPEIPETVPIKNIPLWNSYKSMRNGSIKDPSSIEHKHGTLSLMQLRKEKIQSSNKNYHDNF